VQVQVQERAQVQVQVQAQGQVVEQGQGRCLFQDSEQGSLIGRHRGLDRLDLLGTSPTDLGRSIRMG